MDHRNAIAMDGKIFIYPTETHARVGGGVVVGLEEVVVCRWRIKLADATQLIDSAWVQEFNSDRVNK